MYPGRGGPADTSAARSRLPVSVVALSAAAGVLVAAAAYTAGRLGHAGASWADRMYWLGQLLILTPVAARLLSRRALAASETVTLVVVLTVAEYLVKVCYSPAAFTYADELMHWRTATDISQTGRLFTANNLLPISPYYPGLEEVTSALASITGLSIFTSGLIVAGAAHLLFVGVLFLLFRYVSGSHRIAGVALLLYASESLFQSFDSMFVYQTLALPFLGLTVLAVYRLAAPQAAGFIAALAVIRLTDNSLRWPVIRADLRRRAPVVVAAAVVAALVLILNGLVNGWPPFWERLPGPYQVAGAERSVGPDQVASADWALAALGPGNRFATDEGDLPVLGSYGDQNTVGDDGYLYTSPAFTPAAAQQVQAESIGYVLVDRRLSEMLPASGQYFPVDPNVGKYTRPLPLADLTKFNHVPGVARIYDSGNIVIYDLKGSAYYGS